MHRLKLRTTDTYEFVSLYTDEHAIKETIINNNSEQCILKLSKASFTTGEYHERFKFVKGKEKKRRKNLIILMWGTYSYPKIYSI